MFSINVKSQTGQPALSVLQPVMGSESETTGGQLGHALMPDIEININFKQKLIPSPCPTRQRLHILKQDGNTAAPSDDTDIELNRYPDYISPNADSDREQTKSVNSTPNKTQHSYTATPSDDQDTEPITYPDYISLYADPIRAPNISVNSTHNKKEFSYAAAPSNGPDAEPKRYPDSRSMHVPLNASPSRPPAESHKKTSVYDTPGTFHNKIQHSSTAALSSEFPDTTLHRYPDYIPLNDKSDIGPAGSLKNVPTKSPTITPEKPLPKLIKGNTTLHGKQPDHHEKKLLGVNYKAGTAATGHSSLERMYPPTYEDVMGTGWDGYLGQEASDFEKSSVNLRQKMSCSEKSFECLGPDICSPPECLVQDTNCSEKPTWKLSTSQKRKRRRRQAEKRYMYNELVSRIHNNLTADGNLEKSLCGMIQ